MISTYLSYRFYSADVTKSLDRVAATRDVSREAEYYKANIGSITSVDGFLKNTRVYNYAMKAYGLEDMVYAKAYMRKVLQSDLTKSDSFVRQLTDPRFLTFAKAFNFKTDGNLVTATVEAQSSAEEDETIGLYSAHRVKQGAAAATEAEYFRSKMATIRSVDELTSNTRLFNYALDAYNIDPSIASAAAIKSVLTSDLSDPDSTANKLGTRYQKLAAAFSFESDGSVAVDATAQTAAQTNSTIFLNYENSDTAASPAAAAFRTQYFKIQTAGVTSADGLANDPILLDYVTTAFGLDPIYESPQKLRNVLTSDLSDPSSYANTLGGKYIKIAQAFNFNTDGSLDAGADAQTATQQDDTIDAFTANYQTKAAKNDKFESNYYEITLPNIKSVDQLIANTKFYNFVVTAFGLDPATESKATIRKALLSDLADPLSFANATRNPAYKKMAEAFNFDSKGNAQAPQLAQGETAQQATMALYSKAVGDATAKQTSTQDENDYYNATTDGIRSADELLADKRLVAFIQKAYGFTDRDLPPDTLRRVLLSDPLDKKSFVNQPDNKKFRDIAIAFNFTSDGSVKRAALSETQSKQQYVQTADLYLRQSMEENAGSDNEGVRLALYFQRKASTITSAYSILADKALLQVARTALSLPASISLIDIDKQAALIDRKLKIADLKDPAKLEKFLARFSALYDLSNSSTGTSSIASLFAAQ